MNLRPIGRSLLYIHKGCTPLIDGFPVRRDHLWNYKGYPRSWIHRTQINRTHFCRIVNHLAGNTTATHDSTRDDFFPIKVIENPRPPDPRKPVVCRACYSLSLTHAHIHTYTHAHTHARTRTHTHTRTLKIQRPSTSSTEDSNCLTSLYKRKMSCTWQRKTWNSNLAGSFASEKLKDRDLLFSLFCFECVMSSATV